jgi:hypothetical protein
VSDVRPLLWLPTFLAFPLGGFIVVHTVGDIDGVLPATAGGLIVGAILGTAQWLALRERGIGPRWAIHTAVGLTAGSALSSALTGTGTELENLMVTGFIEGAVMGAAQAAVLARGPLVTLAWTAVVAVAWSLGWLTTWAIGVDVESEYAVFGSSGAIVATIITGLALWRLLADGRPTGPAWPALGPGT